MELEIKRGLEPLGKNRRLTSAGLNPTEPSPATTGLMNFRWKLQLGPVGIRVHLMVFSGKPAESDSNNPNTYHAVFLLFQKSKLYCEELLYLRETQEFTICYLNASSRLNNRRINNNNNSCSSNSLLQLWIGQQAIKNSRRG